MTDPGSRVDAVVFDLDGVLVDSEELWDRTRRALATEAGRPWPQQATRAMQGMSTPEWARYLCDRVGIPGAPEQVAAEVIGRMDASYRQDLPVLPGAVAAVKRIAARWPVGLASSSPRRLIDAILAATGLGTIFKMTISTEEVAEGKPSPVVYLEAVDRLGAAAGHTVAIEDSSNGLRSAAAAGLVVLAVPNVAFPPAADALALAAASIPSVEHLTVQIIESAATAAGSSG